MKALLQLLFFAAATQAAPTWLADRLEEVQAVLKPGKQQSAVSHATSPGLLITNDEFESWLAHETDLSFESILANTGGYGQGLDGVLPGTVIASPSHNRPNYYYQWTRDTAISIKSLITRYNDLGAANETLRAVVHDYVASSKKIQRVTNPSGSFEDLEGLGEPKFEVDGKPFTGHWGRPQRDGPPLRASSIMDFVNVEVRLNQSASLEHFADWYSDVVRPDLLYVTQHWNDSGFDLWEEVYGNHFFTAMVNLRSMMLGAEFARAMGDTDLAHEMQLTAVEIRSGLPSFVSPSKTHLMETPGYPRSGLDAALFLGSLHALDLYQWDGSEDNDVVYPPYSDEVVASLDMMISDMRYRYPINVRRLDQFTLQGKNSTMAGVGIGRYPEDVYDGAEVSTGNPWFLCTATVAQTLYLIADHLNTRPDEYTLMLTDNTKPFYGRFLQEVQGWDGERGNVTRGDAAYDELVSGLIDYADSFLDVIREHHAQDGTMSEQFSRFDGYMKGAERLTWSYSAFWYASRQRNQTLSRASALL